MQKVAITVTEKKGNHAAKNRPVMTATVMATFSSLMAAPGVVPQRWESEQLDSLLRAWNRVTLKI